MALAFIIGALLMLSAIIIDMQPTETFFIGGFELKHNHATAWMFWGGLLIILFGGGSEVKHQHEKKVTINVDPYGRGK